MVGTWLNLAVLKHSGKGSQTGTIKQKTQVPAHMESRRHFLQVKWHPLPKTGKPIPRLKLNGVLNTSPKDTKSHVRHWTILILLVGTDQNTKGFTNERLH